jgi:hypothetical protein
LEHKSIAEISSLNTVWLLKRTKKTPRYPVTALLHVKPQPDSQFGFVHLHQPLETALALDASASMEETNKKDGNPVATVLLWFCDQSSSGQIFHPLFGVSVAMGPFPT